MYLRAPASHNRMCIVSPCLEQTAVLQVVFDNHVRHGVEHELDVGGVGGARQVRVNFLLVFPLVQVFELHPDVAGRLLVRVGAWE